MVAAIPDTADIHRVVPAALLHKPPAMRYPTWEAFRPTKDDEAQHPVRVSVWDGRRTTGVQARALRLEVLVARGAPPKEFHAFTLGVAAVSKVRDEIKSSRMRVVLDPDGCAPELSGRPGAEGHAGIEGLDRVDGELTKPQWKDCLRSLADLCRPAED